MANLGNQKIKDTYQLVLQTDAGGNLQKLDGSSPTPFIINQNLRYLDGTTHPSGYVLMSDGSGNASWGAVAFSGDVYISGGSIEGATIELRTTSGNTVSVPGLSWSSSTSGHISNSGLTGNVGIGTNTPNEKLTVVGDISGTTDLHIGRNITTTNNLTVNIDTLYGDSDTGNVGVGNLNPSHKLTISGNTFLSVMLGVGRTITGTKNDVRISFNGGATTLGLVAGMQLKIVDGNGITQTVTISSIVSEFTIHLKAPFPGSDFSTSTFRYSTSNNTNQFAVYSGTNIAFQVSGDVVMSGSTDLLDIFASSGITNQDVYWSASTGGITNSGLTGNVGIGTSTPNEKLTVSGAISGNSTMAATLYNSTTSLSGYKLNGAKYLWLTSGDLQVGNVGTDTDIIGTSISLQTATTINDNLTVTGSIVSSNEDVYMFSNRGQGQTDATHWYGPNFQGIYNYSWSKDYGTDSGVLTLEEDYINTGLLVPYDCILTGFFTIGHTNTGTVGYSCGLWYITQGNLASSLNVTAGAAGNAALTLAGSIGTTVNPGSGKNPLTLDKRGTMSVALTVGSMIYPRVGDSAVVTDTTWNVYLKRT